MKGSARFFYALMALLGFLYLCYFVGSTWFPKLGASLQNIVNDEDNSYGRLNALDEKLARVVFQLIGNQNVEDAYVVHQKENFAVIEVSSNDHKVPFLQETKSGEFFGHRIVLYGVDGGKKPFVEVSNLKWNDEGLIPYLQEEKASVAVFKKDDKAN